VAFFTQVEVVAIKAKVLERTRLYLASAEVASKVSTQKGSGGEMVKEVVGLPSTTAHRSLQPS
jgi:hypothetical protein